MGKITEYSIRDQKLWDNIVRSFLDYDVFYLSDYSYAFMRESPKNGTPILLYYENDDDRAINVVFRRDIALDEKLKGKIENGQYFDLITPYGYGGFWGSVSDWDELNSCYAQYCIDHHYVCEFVRFELFSNYFAHYDGKVETRSHNVIRNLEMPIDEMWMDFKSKVRKNVKRANVYDLEIIVENTDAHMEDFLRIYYSTMDRTDAANEYYFSKKFYDDLNRMKDNLMYFYTVYKGQVISTELVVYGSENCYSYLGGTDREYFNTRPNDFLKFEIIKWAKKKGLRNFVLGGGYGADDGIFQYKQYLAPHGVVNFYIGQKIFNKLSYNKLLELRTGDQLDEKYFPLYRS